MTIKPVKRFFACLFTHRHYWHENYGRLECLKCSKPEQAWGWSRSKVFRAYYLTFHYAGRYLRDPSVWLWRHTAGAAKWQEQQAQIAARIGTEEWIAKIREHEAELRSKHIPFRERQRAVRESIQRARESREEKENKIGDPLTDPLTDPLKSQPMRGQENPE